MNAFLRQPALRVFLALACANCFGAGGAVADDRARSVIEKAIDATGGRETLKKFPASRGKARGKGELNGMPATFIVSGMMHGPDRMKETTEVNIQGRKLLITRVVNGPKAWVRAGGRTVALQGDALQKLQDAIYSNAVMRLLPLLEEERFSLKMLDSIEVDGRPAQGVRVSSRGQKEIDLYFDNESGLLVKRANRVLDDSLKEVAQEEFHSDYKVTQGIRTSWKTVKFRDGKKILEVEVIEHRFLESLDDAEFDEPTSDEEP